MADIEQEARAEAAEEYRASTGWTMAEGNDICEAFEQGAIWQASRPASPAAPWGESGCFAHCDPEGWAQCRKLAAPATVAGAVELERLRAWKAEALEVLNAWERVWEAAGRPGRIGRSKAENVREWIEAITEKGDDRG